MSSAPRRETIHLSLGSTANAISAHLLNLEGLAATSSSCEADVTHGVYKEFHVPRCLFVEEGEALEFTTPSEASSSSGAAVSEYIQASNVLAYSKHSRYRAPPKQQQQQQNYSTQSNGRHVDWGDEEEEEEEEEESEEDRQRREERERNQWRNQYLEPIQQQLEDHWDPTKQDTDVETSALEDNKEKNGLTEELKPRLLDWKEFFAPPHPVNHRCPLPFSGKSILVDTWDTYLKGSSSLGDWKEDELFERVRHILEESDGVQGVTLVAEGHGMYSGLATSLLQHFQDECRTAGRIMMNVTDPPSPQNDSIVDTWQPAHVRRVRRNIESGLAMFDYGQFAHCILPVSVASGSNSNTNLFKCSSQIALAWETATLAYRATPKNVLIATGGHYQGDGSRLSVREFMASLLPSSRHKLLEMDFSDSSTNKDLSSSLVPGTSVERRLLQQKRQSKQGRNMAPGEWVETSLQRLSPSDSSARALHHHWSIASSVRSAFPTPEDDLTCMMEGMGIRFRPESTFGVVMDQTLHQLTSGGYGAGAYWRAESEQAVVSVLSNSTRSYKYAKTIANRMKEGLSFKFKGYHNRDVTNGILPEGEDCLEAKEYCLGLRDTYDPPDGSGLREDHEGTYFDDEAM